MEYILYIMKSQKNGMYYIGQTDNLNRRIQEHNLGKSKFTKNGIPWAVVYRENYISRKDAIKRERQLKKTKRRYILEKLIALYRGVEK